MSWSPFRPSPPPSQIVIGIASSPSVGEVVEREVVGRGLRARAARADLLLVNELRIGRVRHVEELQDDAVEVGEVAVVVRVEADREQVLRVDAVHVRREAGDLELAEDRRARRLVEVDDEERIGLLERHDVAAVVVEAHGADVLAGRDLLDRRRRARGCRSRSRRGSTRRSRPSGSGTRPLRRRDAEVAVPLVHRELVEHVAGDDAAADVARLAAGSRRSGTCGSRSPRRRTDA